MTIGIAGPSNAGKSGLAAAIAREFHSVGTAVLCQDDYVFPEKQLPRIRDRIDWELPGTIDFDRLRSDILAAKKRAEMVIVEGFLLFTRDSLNRLFDKMIFLEITEETFRERKAKDDRWGHEPAWYVDHIWESFLLYGQPPAGEDLLVIEGENPWPMERILEFLNK